MFITFSGEHISHEQAENSHPSYSPYQVIMRNIRKHQRIITTQIRIHILTEEILTEEILTEEIGRDLWMNAF